MMLLWDHIGHDGPGSRTDNPDADTGQKPLDEQQRQGIRQKEACYAGRIQQQPGAQDAPAAEKRQKVARDETPGQASDDHDARGEARCAQAHGVGLPRIRGAGDEYQVIGRHDQQIDQSYHIEVTVAYLPQRFPRSPF